MKKLSELINRPVRKESTVPYTPVISDVDSVSTELVFMAEAPSPVEALVKKARTKATKEKTEKKPKAPPKQKATRVEDTVELRMEWTLADLPSSRHKTGLAGLYLCMKHHDRSSAKKGLAEVTELREDGLVVRFDREGLQSLFNHIYRLEAVEYVRAAPNAKVDKHLIKKKKESIPGAHYLGTVENDKGKTLHRWVQDDPVYPLLLDWEEPNDNKGMQSKHPWRSLNIRMLRTRVAEQDIWARLKDRFVVANPDKKEASDGVALFEELVGSSTPMGDGVACLTRSVLVDTKKAYAVIHEQLTIEHASLKEFLKDSFLLPFWEQVLPTYALNTFDYKGNVDETQYVIPFPDITNLEEFVRDWPLVMRERPTDHAYYFLGVPSAAVLSTPVEAGLSSSFFLKRVEDRHSLVHRCVSGFDVAAIRRKGQVSTIAAVTRYIPDVKMEDEYARILNQHYKHAPIKALLLKNILANRSWEFGFSDLMSAMTRPQLMIHPDAEKARWRSDYHRDVERTYVEKMQQSTDGIENIILQRVRAYVHFRTKQKTKAGAPDYWQKVDDTREEVFYAIRSRKSPDELARYWAETICRAPWTYKGDSGFAALAEFMINPEGPMAERVRNLSLLSLSSLRHKTSGGDAPSEQVGPAENEEVGPSLDDIPGDEVSDEDEEA